MEIHRYDSGILSSNMFVLSENGHVIVIDPARDTVPGNGLTVDLLLATHEHYDHISGVNAWKEIVHAPLLCSAACAEQIKDPRKNLARHFDVLCEIQSWVQIEKIPEIDTDYRCEADRTFQGESVFEWQDHAVRLFELPGHSPGSIGILIDEIHFFSGDSLLENMEIELGFPGGSRKLWKEISEPRIMSIPKGTRVWPGHFDSFVI